MTPIELVLSKLPNAKRNGTGWQSPCPAHDDRRPSLSVAEGDDGRAVVHCHAGCTAEAVVTALGLNLADLMPPRESGLNGKAPRKGNTAPRREAPTYPTAREAIAALEARHGPRAALWMYKSAAGEPVGVVVRWNTAEGKDVRPVSRTPGGRWVVGGMPEPRPLFALPDLLARPGERVFVCEGEPAAEAARSIGLLATTSPHGAKSAGKADWRPLAGREVVLLPDNDPPGRQYAETVAGLLGALNPPAKVRLLELPGLPEGGDFVEYLEPRDGVEPDAIRAEVERLADAAEALEPEPPSPGPLRFREFPVEALPPDLRRFVEAVAAATGTNPAFAALAALVTAAGCIGNRAAALVKGGWIEPAVLWGGAVGRSSTVKSPVLKLTTRALVELYKAERAAYVEATAEHAREMEHFGVRLAEWKRDQKKGPPTDPPEPPEPPREKRVVVSDITVEKLGCLLQDNPLGLLLVRDELAAWIGSFDRYAAGGKGSDGPAWLSMYDAAAVVIDRKSGNGTIFCERAAVSVLGSIQPGTLARVFGAPEREAGLLGRVLLAYPPDRPALWTDDELPDEVAAEWRELLHGLLALEPGIDDDGTARPRFMPLADEAKRLFVEWHDQHARETAAVEGDDLAAHFGKLKGACLRFALIFECVAVATGAGGRAAIGADSMRRAIAVTEWFKHEGRRLYGQLAESDEERDRRKLVELIERVGKPVTPRDLMRHSRVFATAADAETAIQGLVKLGLGTWAMDDHDGGRGQPARRFRLNGAVDVDANSGIPNETGICVNVNAVNAVENAPDADGDEPPAEPPPEWTSEPPANHGLDNPDFGGAVDAEWGKL
jgi:hypothetical protein